MQNIAMSTVRGFEGNPKKHDIHEIKASIRRFGVVAPIVITPDATLVAGHGRVEALRELKAEGFVPAGIEVDGDEWFLPARCVPFASSEEAAAYVIADNRLVERGGWDFDALSAMVSAIPDFDGVGFTEADIARLTGNVVMPDVKEVEEGRFRHECPKCGYGWD